VTHNKIDKPAGVAEQQVVSTAALLLDVGHEYDEFHCPAEALNIGVAVSLTVTKQTLFFKYTLDMQLLQYRLSV